MTAAPLDQILGLAGTLTNSFSLVLPEKRPHDVITLAHTRAAERLQQVASWLWRGSDLAIVSKRIPFTAITKDDLWRYYESLPLEQRADRLIAFFIFVEVMQAHGVLTRDQFPKIRRAIDVYGGALSLACFFPQRVFYSLHGVLWSVEGIVARREVHEAPTPLPLSADTEAAVSQAVDAAWSALRGSTSASATGAGASFGSWTSFWVTMIVAVFTGSGALMWWLDVGRVQQKVRQLLANRQRPLPLALPPR
mmetsp:Transcript_28770/g.67037  ORF Transcript_28770/g.67037 Transcript_28770/m.67037 type:complete len:251 (+) Transcript_28770:54-806(+)